MKILLIAPLSAEYSGIRNYGVPSIGIHRLASYLTAHGQDVTVYDCNIHDKSIIKNHYDIIGISILSDTLALSLEMFITLRQLHPDVFLVAGGPEAILNYQEMFDTTDINAVILGEGEEPMLQLCHVLSGSDIISIGGIDGIIYRNRHNIVTNDALWDYYKSIDFVKMGWREYWKLNESVGDSAENAKERFVRLVTSSHCNRGCSFCSVTRMHEFSCGRRIPPAYLFGAHIEMLLNRIVEQLPETTGVYFVEDSILPTIQRLDDFCSALKKFKGRLKFLVQTETDKTTREVVEKLADAGVIHISFGVENCSPRIRKLMHKPQNEQRIEDIIKWCNEFNIRCYYLIILFSPESTIEDLVINYQTLTRWQNEGKVVVSVEPFMMPYRGSSIYTDDYDFGYKTTKLSNGKTLKHPYIIYPKDTQARNVMLQLKSRLPNELEKHKTEAGHKHLSKDYTGKIIVKLLGELLTANYVPTGWRS